MAGSPLAVLPTVVNEEDNSCRVVVSGSSGMTAQHSLSRQTEVLDPRTSEWVVTVTNVERVKWLGSWRCPLPLQQDANFCSLAQLVKCDEERELPSQPVEHRIYNLETALDLVAADQPAIETRHPPFLESSGPPSEEQSSMKMVNRGQDETDRITSDEVVGESAQCQPEHFSSTNFEGLPEDIQSHILKNLRYEQLFSLKAVSNPLKEFIESPQFQSVRGKVVSKECTLTLLCFSLNDGALQVSGFDVDQKTWRTLPPSQCLPLEGREDWMLSAGGGLLCARASTSSDREELMVFNPLTQTKRVLPPLTFPRTPVVVHILENEEDNSYRVVVSGSSRMTADHSLSRKTEVFDSRTSKWEVAGDIPTFEYGLNDHQPGVCINKIIYCIAIMGDGSGKGVFAYHMETAKWLGNWRCPLPLQQDCPIVQLVKCSGELYLFVQRELPDQPVEHCIYKLKNALDLVAANRPAIETYRWIEVVKEQQVSSRGLLVYPEYRCESFGDGKLCIFNTIECKGRVYDVRNGDRCPEPLSSLGRETKVIHCLNPLSGTFEPMFKSNPWPTYYSRRDREGCTSSDSDFDAMLPGWHFDPQLPANAEATELSVESDDLQLFPPII